MPAPARARAPGRHARREAQPGPQRDAGAAQRDEQPERQHGHAERGADRERELLGAGQVGEPPGRVLRGVRQVGGDDDQAREQGGQRRPEEAVVRLQHAGEHQADAVEHHLRQEHQQHPGPVSTAPSQADDPPSTSRTSSGAAKRPQQRDRDEDHHRPRQQRARGPRDLLAVAAGHGTGQHRHHEAGQGSAGHHLEEHVRQRVDGGVGVADAGRADRAAQRRRPAEADDARHDGDQRDAGRGAEQAGAEPAGEPHGSRPSRSSARSGGTASITRL
jgi:hypothetical protein